MNNSAIRFICCLTLNRLINKSSQYFSRKLYSKTAMLLLVLGCISTTVEAYENLNQSGFDDAKMLDQGFLTRDINKPNWVNWYNNFNINHKKYHRWPRRYKPSLFKMYSPQYPLWSDGATKKRWIYLPRNKNIDTSNPDEWVFPVGTKIWKEFSFDEYGKNRKIETRLLEKLPDENWRMETFVWNDEQTSAVKAPTEGIPDHYELANGKYYDIPSQHDCEFCHSKAGLDRGPQKTAVLGFSALQLSDDRDSNALHGEQLEKSMLTLSKLQSWGRVTRKMNFMPAIPEMKSAPLQRSVFGYLHANCGHCHNEKGLAEFTNTLNFNHSATARHIQQNGTYKTAISKTVTRYLQPAGSPQYVIDPGFPDSSALLYRMTEENEEYTFKIPDWHHSAGFSLTLGVKMPFVGTNVIDQQAVERIREYILNLDYN